MFCVFNVYRQSQGQKGKQQSHDPQGQQVHVRSSVLLPTSINVSLDSRWPTSTQITHGNFPNKLCGSHLNHQHQFVQSSRPPHVPIEVSSYVHPQRDDVVVLRVCLSCLISGCRVPEKNVRCEAQSTTFNSSINQASVHAWIIDWVNLEETAYFYFLLDGHVVGRSVPSRGSIMECLSLARKWG